MPHLAKFRWIIFAGLTVGAVRLALEFILPDAASAIGLYYCMPVILLVAGLKRTLDSLTWGPLLGHTFVAAFIIWFASTFAGYTTAQFMGWDFGRYDYDEAYAEAQVEARKRNEARAEGSPEITAETILGRKWEGKQMMAPGDSVASKLKVGAVTALVGSCFGAAWATLWAAILIGFPAHLRRRPTG